LQAGFKDINFGALANVSLTGDLLGGLSVFAIGNYSKLLGDFGRSPIVRDRNQWFGGLGLAYTF
jgi:MipA family protein